MSAIVSIGVYLPRLRLSRTAIAHALQWLSPGTAHERGARTLAFWDEDSITMAVEAGRHCLARHAPSTSAITALHLATTTPVFIECQNAAIAHAALRLPVSCATQDDCGTKRAGLIALHNALEHDSASLILAVDRPVETPGSNAEARYGDGAAAVLVSGTEDGALLAYRGGASIAAPFIDRYRAQGQDLAVDWEERWIRDEGYLAFVPAAIEQALGRAGLGPQDIDHFIMPSVISGCGKAVALKAGLTKANIASNLMNECGDTGAAHALIMLASAMEVIKPGERILVAQFGQGATALIFEALPAIAQLAPVVAPQLANGIVENNYLKLPIFRGLLPWDKGLRGRVNVHEALSAAFRRADDLLGFVGGRCRQTHVVQFPISRLAASSDKFELDTLEPYPLADRGGTVATCTADNLAFSRHPPNCYGLIDFNGGGRLMMDFTDPDAAELKTGDAVRFVFRVKDIDERTFYRRYFWKAIAEGAAHSQPHKEE